MEDNNILAVVLAGGKSKRFGEDKKPDKNLVIKTLLEHVLLKISNRYEEILIVSSHSLDTKKNKKYNNNS